MGTTSNKQKPIAQDTRQLDLFSLLAPPAAPLDGGLNFDVALRAAISKAITRSGKDRIDICAELYKLTGVEVSIHSLNSWSAESKAKSNDDLDASSNRRWGMPAEMIPAFCAATGDYEALHVVVEATGLYKAVTGRDLIRAKKTEIEEDIKKLKSQAKEFERALERSA